MVKRILKPNTTLYPVPIVLITAGGDQPNVMTCNRIISCSAEPPRLAISIRPSRYTHHLIQETGEFVVNIPTPNQIGLSDYLGVVTGRNEDKIAIAGVNLTPAVDVKTPLLTKCPVNIECGVESFLELDSHTMFIGRVLAIHADEAVLDPHDDVDISLARGLVYDSGVVRERPTYKFRVEDLRREQSKHEKDTNSYH
jgi:flavin reductase (DIM6/NTAB) family NADH-FMN oxidoreductase RutF